MSDFIDAVATILSFIAKMIAGIICTILLLFSILDIFRWPEWFSSVSNSVNRGFWVYCRCGAMSFCLLWIDFLTLFPAAMASCSWRIVSVFKVFQKHFNHVEGNEFIWNPTIRGKLWLVFFLFLSDIPFIFLSLGTCFVPWRLPYLINILYVEITSDSSVGSSPDTRAHIFLNFVLGFFDIVTVLFAFLTLFSPIRLYMWVTRWKSHNHWHFWPFDANKVNIEPRMITCVAGLLVIPDFVAYAGYFFALPFFWNWKACFLGHYLRAKYDILSFVRNSQETFEEEFALSFSYFLRGWMYVLIGFTDLITVFAGLFVFGSWRGVRAYRQVNAHWESLTKESNARMAQKASNLRNNKLRNNPSERTQSDTELCDPEMHDASLETRLIILFQFLLLLTDLIFGALALLTMGLLIRSYPLVRRLRKVAMKPIKGHNPRGWYYCNYRMTIIIEFAKTFIFILSLPLTLLLLITVYRVPVCYNDMKKVKETWLLQQEELRKQLAEKIEKESQPIAADESQKDREEHAPTANYSDTPAGKDQPIGLVKSNSGTPTQVDDKAIPLSQEDTTPRLGPADYGSGKSVNIQVPPAPRKYEDEIDEEEEERALFFEYATVFGVNVALILVDALFLPLLVFNIVTLFRTHRQIREFIYVPKVDLETPATYRRFSILNNFIRVFRDAFCTFFVWPFTLLCPPRFVMCIINLIASLRASADPLPAIRVYHWSWTFEQGHGWRLKIAGYVDPEGPHKELLNAHPSSISLNITGESFWFSLSNYYGGFKTGVIKSMLPMTFKGTDKQMRHIEPFTTSTSAGLPSDVAPNYFVDVDCQTLRVTKKMLKGVGTHANMDVPLVIVLLFKGGRNTLARIETTGNALDAADASGTSVDLAATDAAFAQVSTSSQSAGVKDITAEDFGPYACDMWWYFTLTQAGQTLFDLVALFCFLFAHIVPIRAFLLYRDLFVNGARKRAETAGDYLRLFRNDYISHNKNHMHMVESYEMHINQVHKRSVALDGQYLPDRFETGGYNDNNGASETFNCVEKYSLGSELAGFRQSSLRSLKGAATNAPTDICAMCATLFNNVLLVCGVVGDKFFDDMADLLADGEEADTVGRSKDLRDKILNLNSVPKRTFLTAAPNATLGSDMNEDRAGQHGWSTVTVQSSLVSVQLKPNEDESDVSKRYSIHDKLETLTKQYGSLGTKLLERGVRKAGNDQDDDVADSEKRLSFIAEYAKRAKMPPFEEPTNSIIAMQMGITEDQLLAMEEEIQEAMLVESRTYQRQKYREKYGHEPNEMAFRSCLTRKLKAARRQNKFLGEDEPIDEVQQYKDIYLDDPDVDQAYSEYLERQAQQKRELEEAIETKPTEDDNHALTVAETSKLLPVTQIISIFAEAQELLLSDLKTAIDSYEKDCKQMAFTKINYDYTEARLRCMYHAAMVFVDFFTFVALLIVAAPIYRIPTLISYIRHRNRYYGNHNWRWAILETFGEILLDVIFAVLYLICIVSIVEIVYVHVAMYKRFTRNPSFWGLREGIFDALVDLFSKFARAMEAIFRCSAVYYIMMTIVCCIVAPVELATNHFGLSTAKCGCLRGWMLAMLGWLVLVIMPFAVAYKGTDTISEFTPLLYAYVGLIAFFIVIFLVVLIVRAPRRDQIQASMAFVPLSGATIASFIYPILESAQLCALPIIVATAARHFDITNQGFVFDNTWLSDAAHYLFLDHVTRFHAYSAGSSFADESNQYPVGYYLSFSVAVLIFFFVSLPVVIDGLLNKRKNIAHNSLWRSIVFLGNVAALFVSRNLVAWLDCSDQSSFWVNTTSVELFTNGTNMTNFHNDLYNPMQVGEAYLNFACWHQVDSSLITGAFTMLFMALFAVMVVLKGVRFAQDDAEIGEDEIQAVFHEVADTYATILHVVLGTLSGLMYSKPLAYCILQAVVLGLFVIIHIRNKPLITPLFPVNSIASVWQLNTFRNIGYLTAVATSAICAAAIAKSTDEDFVASNSFPIAIFIVWAAMAALMAFIMVISLTCPKLTGDDKSIHQWEQLLVDTEAFVNQLADEGRFISWLRGSRLTTFHKRIRRAHSLQQYVTILIDIEGSVHVAAYNANFFNARRNWWARAVQLGHKGIREDTLEEAEELLQSLKNGCLAPLPEEPTYDLVALKFAKDAVESPKRTDESKQLGQYSTLNSSKELERSSGANPVIVEANGDLVPNFSGVAREPTAEEFEAILPAQGQNNTDKNEERAGVAEDLDL